VEKRAVDLIVDEQVHGRAVLPCLGDHFTLDDAISCRQMIFEKTLENRLAILAAVTSMLHDSGFF